MDGLIFDVFLIGTKNHLVRNDYGMFAETKEGSSMLLLHFRRVHDRLISQQFTTAFFNFT
jgi:hypothetical protein